MSPNDHLLGLIINHSPHPPSVQLQTRVFACFLTTSISNSDLSSSSSAKGTKLPGHCLRSSTGHHV